MQTLANRPWVPRHCEAYIQKLAPEVRRQDSAAIDTTLERLARENRDIHARLYQPHSCLQRDEPVGRGHVGRVYAIYSFLDALEAAASLSQSSREMLYTRHPSW